MPWFPGAIPVRPAAEVTRRGDSEEPPSGPRERDALEQIWRRVVDWYDSGLCPAMSLCLRRGGRVVLERSIGLARGVRGSHPQVAEPDTLFQVFSASKMVVGVLIHQACQRGELGLDQPVADLVPEFAASGKHTITIRDVLTHRSGLPRLSEPTTLDLLEDRPRIVAQLCAATPSSRPGRLAYHALSGGYILGEVLERATGRDIQSLLRQRIAQPLGLSHFRYGAAPEDLGRVAENHYTGLPLLPPLSTAVVRALGIEAEEATRLSNDPRFLASIIPAGNLVTSAGEACRFMEALRTADPRLVDRARMDEILASQPRLEFDHTLILPVRHGLGFMRGGRWISPYGFDTTRAFGHLGFMQVLLWADPQRQLSGALLTSGKTFLSPGLFHFARVMQTIARGLS